MLPTPTPASLGFEGLQVMWSLQNDGKAGLYHLHAVFNLVDPETKTARSTWREGQKRWEACRQVEFEGGRHTHRYGMHFSAEAVGSFENLVQYGERSRDKSSLDAFAARDLAAEQREAQKQTQLRAAIEREREAAAERKAERERNADMGFYIERGYKTLYPPAANPKTSSATDVSNIGNAASSATTKTSGSLAVNADLSTSANAEIDKYVADLKSGQRLTVIYSLQQNTAHAWLAP